MNPMDLLGPGGIGEEMIIAIAALAAFINVFLLYRVMLERDPLDARVREMKERMRELREGISGPKRRSKREQSIGFMRQTVKRFNLLRSRQGEKAALALARAGWRSRDGLSVYFFLKLSLPFAFGACAVLVLLVGNVGDMTVTTRVGVALLAVVLGAYAPDIFVRNAISKRQIALTKGLPDALDLLVICAEAGQTLDAALGRVAREMAQSSPAIADELHLTSLELGLLPERRQALLNLDKRTNLPAIRAVVNTLNQTEKYGTPLAQSLRVMAAEFRNDRMMRAEAKAARLPAILTVPMIIFILPPLFVVLLGPAVLKVMDNFIGLSVG